MLFVNRFRFHASLSHYTTLGFLRYCLFFFFLNALVENRRVSPDTLGGRVCAFTQSGSDSRFGPQA